MKLNNSTTLKDNRTKCYSMMSVVNTKDYLNFIRETYKDKGGIEEQREPLKTSSAIRIRQRMIEDIIQGTILPPIVVGVVIKNEILEKLNQGIDVDFETELADISADNLFIIDGMQRTAALFSAVEKKDINNLLRVELWLAESVNSLIYRMLVLNTGQVPWNLRRQIEVVFRSMINDIKQSVEEVEIIKISDNGRSNQAGQYHANDIVELYLVYGARKEKIDTKERLADEFTRLDFIEATEDDEFTKMFYTSLKYLALLDKQFAKYAPQENKGRFSNGRDIFKSQPARVGFITSLSKQIFGRPGIDRTDMERHKIWRQLENNLNSFINKLDKQTPEEIGDFLNLGMLNESLDRKTSKVGDFEREYFTKAFETLIELQYEIPNMEVCWRAY